MSYPAFSHLMSVYMFLIFQSKLLAREVKGRFQKLWPCGPKYS